MSLACEVCYEFYSSKTPARVIAACGHDFCGPCLRALIMQQYARAQCPKCRAFVLGQDHASDCARLLVRAFATGSDAHLFDSLFPVSHTLSELSSRVEFGDRLPPELLQRLLIQVDTASLVRELQFRQAATPAALRSKPKRPPLAAVLLRPWNTNSSSKPNALRSPSPVPPRRRTITPANGDSCEPGLGSLMLMLVVFILSLLETLLVKYPRKLIQRFPRENRTQLLAVLQGVPLLLAATCFLFRMISS
eukprot:Gregarina_sp_Pseudo_9__2359@NODE_2668_length_918_cov_50_037543_g2446_i0_p1_GENE_NODE_2668_length_918_cov_50_037543_g2446_i0NODE_2668_length_918_cov_50_037543_g2446_i0_p1_ORF_typecomplete_len249_score56_86zfRING_5/PF14634_6/6_3e08zfC3HC4_2/PF13923_6/3_4e07zfC3HC4/PF00097_25/6_3e07zfC3HC4_3/PF13920_6/3_7e06ProkRING_4/PF14447_6/9_2e06zfRING_2/PF13639_6/9e06zfRING_UBOX/PF13445_6/1_5e05zfANAPC11/PF12861_7/0_00018zfC3HC4_4/PF15227_6/0_00081zfRING_6/PF14835_6/0_0051zfRING_6/PF14835_6/2_6e03zfrbx1/PF126